MPFVLDNSVAIRWLLGDGSPKTLAYAGHILDLLSGGDEALVPCIWPLEAANVVVKAESKGLITEARGAEFIKLLRNLAITPDVSTYQHALADTLQIAKRYRLSSYDAAYLELALREGLPFATLDEALVKACKKSGVKLA
jgi:predicted nucleic acid-binding protein